MQVGLHTSTLSNTGDLTSSGIKPQVQTLSTSTKETQVGSDYPASPLLTTRPQRYSVQLNDQLTTQQQADSYLAQLEQALLDYRHTALGGRRRAQESTTLQQQARIVVQQLEKRSLLSGGSVDRQLMPVLQGQARVNFHAPALAQAIAPGNAPDLLLFSVQSGSQKKLSAVKVPDDTDARQSAVQINTALRRIGIEAHPQHNEVIFSTTESRYAQVSGTLTLTRGSGAAQPVVVEAEPAQADRLSAALNAGSWGAAQHLVQQTLNQLSEQRQRLAVQQEKAGKLIDAMARFPENQSAVDASAALATTLNRASHNYDVLTKVISGQVNLSKLTVRSLLR